MELCTAVRAAILDGTLECAIAIVKQHKKSVVIASIHNCDVRVAVSVQVTDGHIDRVSSHSVIHVRSERAVAESLENRYDGSVPSSRGSVAGCDVKNAVAIEVSHRNGVTCELTTGNVVGGPNVPSPFPNRTPTLWYAAYTRPTLPSPLKSPAAATM